MPNADCHESHPRLPLIPEPLSDGGGVGFDVAGEPLRCWVVGTGPEPDERVPPDCWDDIDPPAPQHRRGEVVPGCATHAAAAPRCARGRWLRAGRAPRRGGGSGASRFAMR
jgi:hypothetical protein